MRAGAGAALAGQHPGQRGLARAVASDQADPVAGTDAEGGVLQQDSGADAHFDMGGSDHRTIVRDGGARFLREFPPDGGGRVRVLRRLLEY